MATRLVRRFILKLGYWGIIILLILATFFGATAAWSVYQKERVVHKELELAREHVTDLASRQEALQKKLENINTEGGVEHEIRKSFPLTREGEGVIVLLDAKPALDEKEQNSRKSLWAMISGWFRK